jgi:hypothetical protein
MIRKILFHLPLFCGIAAGFLSACTNTEAPEYVASDYVSKWQPADKNDVPTRIINYLQGSDDYFKGETDINDNELKWSDVYPNYTVERLMSSDTEGTRAYVFETYPVFTNSTVKTESETLTADIYNLGGIIDCYKITEISTGKVWYTESYDWKLHEATAAPWRAFTSGAHYYSGNDFFEITVADCTNTSNLDKIGVSRYATSFYVMPGKSTWVTEDSEAGATMRVGYVYHPISCYSGTTFTFEVANLDNNNLTIHFDHTETSNTTWNRQDYSTFANGYDYKCLIKVEANRSETARWLSYTFTKADGSTINRSVLQLGWGNSSAPALNPQNQETRGWSLNAYSASSSSSSL